MFNRHGQVFIARRISNDGPEIVDSHHRWQMPQGGIDPDEDVEAAARRELFEETGVTSVAILGRTGPLRYDFPPYGGPTHRLAAFSGQEQTWFAMRFLGRDEEISVDAVRDGAPPEFDRWRWDRLGAIPELVVPFKRAVYERVVEAFGPFAHAA